MPVECIGATNDGCLLNKLTNALFTRLCIIRDIRVSALSSVSSACQSNYLTYLNSIGRWGLSFLFSVSLFGLWKNIFMAEFNKNQSTRLLNMITNLNYWCYLFYLIVVRNRADEKSHIMQGKTRLIACNKMFYWDIFLCILM